MTTRARYRIEDARSCIDIKVRHSRQLFDGRDPAPFRERDLDEDAVEYRLAAAQEIPRTQPLKIVVTISEEPEPRLAADAIMEAVRGHFIYEREQIERRLREYVRRGQMFLGVGLTVLVVFLTLAAHRVAPVRASARDSSRGARHHRMGRHVATARSPALRLVADRP